MGRYKFQYEDGGSTDFFNSIADVYQQQTQPNYEQQDSENNNENVDTEDNQNSDYEELLAKYQDLEAQLADYSNNVQAQQPDMHDYGDDFLNFLFSDEGNNDPVDWGKIGSLGNAGATIPTNNSGFKNYGTYKEGKNALINQLKLYQTGKTRNPVKPTSTLLEAMSVYAPSSDNNKPVRYAEFIAKKLGISSLTPINQIDTGQWANAIEQMEGNKSNNPGNLRRQTGGYVNIDSTLQANTKVPFVDRILNADKYPTRANKDGSYSTHLMSYADNIAFPSLRLVNGKWIENNNPQSALKANDYIEFKTPEQANYFTQHYKDSRFSKIKLQNGGKYKFATTEAEQFEGLNNNEYDEMEFPTKGVNTFRGLDNGQAVYLSDEYGQNSILYNPLQTATMRGKVWEKRLQTGGRNSYTDSMNLYKAYKLQDKLMGAASKVISNKVKPDEWTTKQLLDARIKKKVKGFDEPIAQDFQSQEDQFYENGKKNYNFTARPEDEQLINYYRSIGYGDKNIMFHNSPDLAGTAIRPIGTYFDGTAESPIFKKPVGAGTPQPPAPRFKRQSQIPLNTPDMSTGNMNVPNIPNFQRAEWDSSKPSPYSFTYPTGPYNEQQTIYFTDETSWRDFISKQKNVSSQSMKGRSTATGYLKQ